MSRADCCCWVRRRPYLIKADCQAWISLWVVQLIHVKSPPSFREIAPPHFVKSPTPHFVKSPTPKTCKVCLLFFPIYISCSWSPETVDNAHDYVGVPLRGSPASQLPLPRKMSPCGWPLTEGGVCPLHAPMAHPPTPMRRAAGLRPDPQRAGLVAPFLSWRFAPVIYRKESNKGVNFGRL